MPSSTEIPVVAVMPNDSSPLRLCIGSPMMPPGSDFAPAESHHRPLSPPAGMPLGQPIPLRQKAFSSPQPEVPLLRADWPV